ncbi:MAG: hypothetical protein V7642_6099 [Burkholderiales bacterium]
MAYLADQVVGSTAIRFAPIDRPVCIAVRYGGGLGQ